MTENNEIIMDSRVYEVSFIFDNTMEEATALDKANVLKETIATLGGSFISEETPYLRELAYEMIRVQNNINVRFNVGYFGWIKFEMSAEKVAMLDKKLKDDESVVRYMIIKTVQENTVFTKRAPVLKAENVRDIALELGNVELVGGDDAEIVETAPLVAEVPVTESVTEEAPAVVVAEETK